jgi:MoaA/NifB/PqqE/SkfB family radical SAM enzyme
MRLSGVHLLLTYQCTFECDHCFVWGSPRQTGTMTLRTIRHILREAAQLGTVKWVYFEGGEPMLFYPVLARAVEEAAGLGFRVGIVSNAYWATDLDDAETSLQPLAGKVEDLSLSSDLYHSNERLSQQARDAHAAAEKLGIPAGLVCIAEPETGTRTATGQLPHGEIGVMFRGRAAEALVARAPQRPWTEFLECPHEELGEPDRVHVDPFGHVHICQGISLGNILEESLREICDRYDPATHPITGPLLDGGPAELARRYEVTRRALRSRFPDVLTPDQMYGVPETA